MALLGGWVLESDFDHPVRVVDDTTLHYLKDPKLWEFRYLPQYG